VSFQLPNSILDVHSEFCLGGGGNGGGADPEAIYNSCLIIKIVDYKNFVARIML
jgi:hypothetical protein